MICSMCHKNQAAIFSSKITPDGKREMEGLCINCAKKQGINTDEILQAQNPTPNNYNQINMNEMNKQLEGLIKNLSENLGDIEGVEFGAIPINENYDDNEDEENSNEGQPKVFAGAIPLGSIFGNLFGGPGAQNSTEEVSSGNVKKKVKPEKKKNKAKKKRFLDVYGTNLTFKAQNNELDMVIGRDKELQRVIQILNRRSKNNPCLIGEPGVGKTAIANALALKIASKNVPAKLLNKEVYLLDMTAVVAGTQFRGQFEARMKGIIEDCIQYGNIILVIDEIHSIIGAGAGGDSDSAMNAANILKPALANGQIQLIGTTTIKEYRKYIEKDTALERRFQQVLIEEPSITDSIGILDGIKKYYEDYHKVKISTDVIKQTVVMSEKYIHDRFLPDKAIDILDEACSRINLENKDLYKLELLRQKLKEVQDQKEEAVTTDSTEDYQKAANLKTEECRLIEEIDKINSSMKIKNLTTQDIANVIENWTKIPVSKITEEETQKLLNLEKNLHKKIIGQEDAVSSVSRAIRRNRAGLQSTKRPPSFIFVGPTGVGKTALAKALSFEMFGKEDSIIRIDMSEYMESNSTAKLIGAPPGYVGYDDAGQLTDKVKRHPYSIILLDEIEKAHPDVFNILLQVLDDGRLTDSQGNTVSFENTIIIMTSNAGSNLNNNSIGFGKSEIDKYKIEERLKEVFRPEFLNRVDEIVAFNSLTNEQLVKIVDLMLLDTATALSDKDITMELSKEAKEFLLEKGTNLKFGARPLRRAIQRYVEDEISEKILKGEIKNGDKINISRNGDSLAF
jgi:ATP-dependent Clp protease ATP-binding subunit ClpC